MPYIAYPAPVMPYHLDGTVVKTIDATIGVMKTFSAAELLELNDEDYTPVYTGAAYENPYIVFFFPELVDLVAIFAVSWSYPGGGGSIPEPITNLYWSNDTTNGLDGTWNAATMADGYPAVTMNLDSWRTGFKAITGASAIKAVRFKSAYSRFTELFICHLYGNKTAGQTPDDILFLDAQAADAEFTLPLDFGDIPSGTSLQHQIKIKNSSATLTANTIVLTVVDPDDQIRIGVSGTGPWLTTQTIASLAPGVKSAIFYIKCEAPAPPTPLGPNRAPLKVNVGSWA